MRVPLGFHKWVGANLRMFFRDRATLVWAILFLALAQVAGWSGGPNLMPLAPIILLGLILLETRQPRGGVLGPDPSASASETEPLPRAAARRAYQPTDSARSRSRDAPTSASRRC